MSTTNDAPVQKVITISTKSVGLSLMLTFFFGSVGMLYSTVLGAAIMFVVEVIVGFATMGFGLLITHPICMIWGAIAVKKYNNRLLEYAN